MALFQSVVIKEYPKFIYVYLGKEKEFAELPKNKKKEVTERSETSILWFENRTAAIDYIDYCGGDVVPSEGAEYCRRIIKTH